MVKGRAGRLSVLSPRSLALSPKTIEWIELNIIQPLSFDGFERLPDSHEASEDVLARQASVVKRGYLEQLQTWWGSNVAVIIPQNADIRDYLGSIPSIFLPFDSSSPLYINIPSAATPADNSTSTKIALERTYLSHLRTGLALAMASVLVSQYYTLSFNSIWPGTLGAQNIGIPLGCALLVWAMLVNIIGAIRFMRIQTLMLNGKAIAGGWDMWLEAFGTAVVIVVMTVITLLET
ncbi:hypothetical protein MMC24_006112 [Lignoscripta atroalba]|nr:hypothetical protein [Lignoscripta atroalba]